MADNPRLSVLLTFKNERDEAEDTLTALLELDRIDVELVVMDDGSTDGTQDLVRSLLDHYDHEEAYFFEHEGTYGRGNLLNEGLKELDGPFLWCPERIEEIDEDHLFRVLKALEKTDKAGLLQRPSMIPETVEEWVQYLDSKPLPRDAVYIWNLDRIPPRERFFSPYLINHHGTELASRVLSRENAGLIDPFFSVQYPEEPIQPDINVVSEFVYTLLRRPDLKPGQKDFLLNLLNPSVGEEVPDKADAGDEELFQKALRYYRAGNISASLEFVNSLLDQTPNHLKARKLKIEILEKLRRYVEAAELKHRMRQGEQKKERTPSEKARQDGSDTRAASTADREQQKVKSGEPTAADMKLLSEEAGGRTSESEQEENAASDVEKASSESPSAKSKQDESGTAESVEAGSGVEKESAEAAVDDQDDLQGRTSGDTEDDGPSADPHSMNSEHSSDEAEARTDISAEKIDQKEEAGQEEPIPDDFPDPPHPELDEVTTSIIVPTTADGKPALEQLMVSLSKYVDPRTHELIIVDNASLDDTHDYLEQLEEENYYNCTVITHSRNQGFAASVNAGLDQARGRYACILHNDVSFDGRALKRMAEAMDEDEEIALLGPAADQTINPQQRTENLQSDDQLFDVNYLDSFCMMLRTSTGLQMDEQFGLAYFEDVDLSFQALEEGYRVSVLPSETVTHHQGYTTVGMGLDLDSRQYWHNASLFNEKWDIETGLPEDMEERDEIEQLLILNERANPFYPEERFQQYFDQMMTDEVKTRLLKKELDKGVLLELVDLMLTMDRRDVLRKLEDKIEEFELPSTLIYRLIRYYYRRNIFSRCKHYLQRLPEAEQSPFTHLYELQIAVSEKDMDTAIPMLSDLMNELPAHPEIYRQAAHIHRFEGNKEEAESFMELAEQLDPRSGAEVKVGE